MKKLIIIFFTGFFLSLPSISSSQQMMCTLAGAYKLQKNKNQFIGKPFKELLKEMGPEIKMVVVESERSNFIMLHFYDFQDRKAFDKEGIIPLRITVYLKEKIEWDKINLPKGMDRLKWTQEAIDKLGNHTITYLKVSGKIMK
jgi:hypothetical protein